MYPIREEVVRELVATRKWSDEQARLGERADYRCEYCGFDLLGSVEHYKLWQIDHIVPVSKMSKDEDPTKFDNLAVACKQCNYDFKSRCDPREVAGPQASRDELIAAVRVYIGERKARTEDELARVRAIVGERRSGAGASA